MAEFSRGKVKAIREELAATKASLKQAVDGNNYGAAAEHQAKQAELTAKLDALRKAQVVACGLDMLPLSAADLQAAAMRAWQERVDVLLAPLEPAIATSLAIVQQSLSLAAVEGAMQIGIGKTGSTVDRVVEYTVDLGFCQVPVGRGIHEVPESELVQYHEYSKLPVAKNQYGQVPTNNPNSNPNSNTNPKHTCSEEQLLSYVATFDGNTLHAFADLRRVLQSDVGRLSLRWRLHTAGLRSRAFTTVQRPTTLEAWNGMDENQRLLPWLEVAYGRVGDAFDGPIQNYKWGQDREYTQLGVAESFAAYVEAVVQSRHALV
jgi:hypothetical protein